jgi:hypothetical protein
MKVLVVSTTSTTFFVFLAAELTAAKATGGAPPDTSATDATAPAIFPRCYVIEGLSIER